VARANALAPDLFLSIHHDSVPDSFLQRWQYEGTDHYFSDRFKGHSIFISNDNADVSGSLLFGQLMGEQLKARGLQYTCALHREVHGPPAKTAGGCQDRRLSVRPADRIEEHADAGGAA
jgi:N-acetylmuramoyl-L-alanine amidase